MDFRVLLLGFLAIFASCEGASQRFLRVRSRSRLPATSNYCSRPIKAATTLVMNRRRYNAYSVCSNGHILLLPSSRSRLLKYGSPQPLLRLRRYPMVAGFWANSRQCVWRTRRFPVRRPLRLRRRRRRRRYRISYVRRRYRYCPSRVTYGQSSSYSLRKQVGNLVNDYRFFPKTVIWATYSNMYSYYGSRTNTFQIALASNGYVTYAIFIYGNMGWSRSSGRYRYGYVGYSNGKGRGYQYSLPLYLKHNHLQHSIKIFRISDYHIRTSTSAEEQVDADSLAMLQEAFGQEQDSELEMQDEEGDGSDSEAVEMMDDNSGLTSSSEDTDKFDDEASQAEEDEGGDDDSSLALVSEDEDEEPGNSQGGEELLEKLLTQDEEDSNGDDGKDQDVVKDKKKKDTKE